MKAKGQQWGIVGGGRWGRTLATMLLRGLPLDYVIGIVTTHNDANVERWRSELAPEHHARVRIMRDLDVILGDAATQALVVANRSPMHGETAGRALAANKHVFVEKPFTL